MKLLFLTLLMSCAQMTPTEQVKQEMLEENVSMNAIVNITRTSFLKGCLFGSKLHYYEKPQPSKFEVCRNAAEIHVEELKKLLE